MEAKRRQNNGTSIGLHYEKAYRHFLKAREKHGDDIKDSPFVDYKLRRLGDISECYAETVKAKRELVWTAKRDIIAMRRYAWCFEKYLKS